MVIVPSFRDILLSSFIAQKCRCSSKSISSSSSNPITRRRKKKKRIQHVDCAVWLLEFVARCFAEDGSCRLKFTTITKDLKELVTQLKRKEISSDRENTWFTLNPLLRLQVSLAPLEVSLWFHLLQVCSKGPLSAVTTRLASFTSVNNTS